MFNDMQRAYDIIAILVAKLGGEVVITSNEIENPPVATVTSDHINNKFTFKIDK